MLKYGRNKALRISPSNKQAQHLAPEAFGMTSTGQAPSPFPSDGKPPFAPG